MFGSNDLLTDALWNRPRRRGIDKNKAILRITSGSEVDADSQQILDQLTPAAEEILRDLDSGPFFLSR